ncbi:toprim domain-containing protein [Lactococcus hircilactis]|uniref:toprim domain-containing protein n=1 Tax=Lactococcus hircilactis TaxID=1494462 RepID=UPI0014789F2F
MAEIQTLDDRKELLAQAQSANIFQVAQQLGLKALGSNMYDWEGHQSIWLNPRKNRFNWFSENLWGGPVDLVSLVLFNARTFEERRAHFKEAVAYLTQTEWQKFDVQKIPQAQPFHYYLRDQANKSLAEKYLSKARCLSQATIQFFEEKGLIAQSQWRNTLENGQYFYEPILVFKHFDKPLHMVGASVQGIKAYPELHKDHASGHLKRVLKNSGAYGGMVLDIGQPERLIVFEAPIDLMSYYELHQAELENVKLISSDGYKSQVISRYLAEIYGCEELALVQKEKFLETFDRLAVNIEDLPKQLITFAYDHDEAGKTFVKRFNDQYPNAPKFAQTDFPPLHVGQVKNDWNDELKSQKGLMTMKTESSEKSEKRASFLKLSDTEQTYLIQKSRADEEKKTADQIVAAQHLRELQWNFKKEDQTRLDGLYDQLIDQDFSPLDLLALEPTQDEVVQTLLKETQQFDDEMTNLFTQAPPAPQPQKEATTNPVVEPPQAPQTTSPVETRTSPQKVETKKELPSEVKSVLTKEELEIVLSAHFSKIEGLVNQFKKEVLENKTMSKEETQTEVKGIRAQIHERLLELVNQVKGAILNKRNQMGTALQATRISVTNTLKSPFLKLSQELQAISQNLAQRFALEEVPKTPKKVKSRKALAEELSEKAKVIEDLKAQLATQGQKQPEAEKSKTAKKRSKSKKNFDTRLQQAKEVEQDKIKAVAAQGNLPVAKGISV